MDENTVLPTKAELCEERKLVTSADSICSSIYQITVGVIGYLVREVKLCVSYWSTILQITFERQRHLYKQISRYECNKVLRLHFGKCFSREAKPVLR